ncbi:hypothetical protein QFC24_004210 [Naganishia onofrii]|uniref:Uncharacterized protein n=1 Tax=Naganishia onofrii TaxID=1851511 RepID=A0ACC2XH59_9TREE|nr:hypothetical protein QFC24_004210 [Naganishia onofrii]
MSSQNAGTNSPTQQKEDPMGASDTKGNASKGASGEQQRSHGRSKALLLTFAFLKTESSMEKTETGPSAAAISAAADSAAKIEDPTSSNHGK